MNLFASFILIFLFLTAAYDFYLLKKSNAKISKCVLSSIGTFFINLIVTFFTIGLLAKFFGDDSFVLIAIVAITLTGSLTYFRFQGREIKDGNVVKKKKIEEKKLSPLDQAKEDANQAVWWGYVISVFSVIWIFITKDSDPDIFYFRFADPIIFAALAFWGQKKDPFVPLLIMTALFIIGKLAFLIDAVEKGYKGGAGIGMSVIIAYFLLKGLNAAYKIKFKKLK